MLTAGDLKREIPITLKLALPLAIAQLGQMLMGIVDTLMVGKLGPQFIAAVGLGNSLFWICGLPCIGLLMGLDYLVSSSYGRKDLPKCNFWLIQGIYFGLLISIPSAILMLVISKNFSMFGLEPELAVHAGDFLASYCWSIVPFALFIALRQYIQSMNHVQFVTVITFVANGVNAFLNWIFIYGHGVTPMGVAGSGVATFITRSILLITLVAYAFYLNKKKNLGLEKCAFEIQWQGIRALLTLGIPAATQMLLEVGVFSLAAFLAGKVSVTALATHSIVLNIASFTFMVPLGVSAAAAILVGQAQGRGDADEVRRAGWSSFVLGVGFMCFSALALFLFSKPLLGLFTQDTEVLELGKKILLLAAIFQIADGIQVVGTGALRGLGETKLPMFANLCGHWLIGLPIGIYLCFSKSHGLAGLWLGLTIGLMIVAVVVLAEWVRKVTVNKVTNC